MCLEVPGDVCTEYLDVGHLSAILHVISQDRVCLQDIRYHVIGAYLQ